MAGVVVMVAFIIVLLICFSAGGARLGEGGLGRRVCLRDREEKRPPHPALNPDSH